MFQVHLQVRSIEFCLLKWISIGNYALIMDHLRSRFAASGSKKFLSYFVHNMHETERLTYRFLHRKMTLCLLRMWGQKSVIRTLGPIPYGTCMLSTYWDDPFPVIVFPDYALRSALGTFSILPLTDKERLVSEQTHSDRWGLDANWKSLCVYNVGRKARSSDCIDTVLSLFKFIINIGCL